MVIGDLGPGGAQRMLKNLAEELVSDGARVCVITLAPQHTDFFELDPRVRRVALDIVGESSTLLAALTANVRRIVRLRAAIRASRPRTILSFIGTTNVLTIVATLGLGTRVVISERNDPARQSLGRLWDLLRRWTYRHADVVTAIGQQNLDELRGYVPDAKLRVAPMLIREPETAPQRDESNPTVLNVGRLTNQKAQDVLLRSFSETRSRFPDWRLRLVGVGPMEDEIRALAERLDIADQVEFVGLVRDPYPYYRSAGIFAFPSRFEGVGNALLEAMSCGLPVIITDASPGPLEYVEDGHSGLVVAPDDVEALTIALTRLMEDPALRLRLGANARESVLGRPRSEGISAWRQILALEPQRKVDTG